MSIKNTKMKDLNNIKNTADSCKFVRVSLKNTTGGMTYLKRLFVK